MNVNQREAPAGLPGVLRAIGVLAVVILALVGMGVVFDFIPREALQEWLTAVALTLLMKKS
jgi:hypothetical protein